MSLSELMSSMNLAIWPTVALVIFLAVFVAVMWRVFSPCHHEANRRLGELPLEDDRFTSRTPNTVAVTRSNRSHG